MSCGHVVVTLARFCSRVVGPLDRSVRDSEAALGRGGRQMESSSNLIPSREAKQTATSDRLPTRHISRSSDENYYAAIIITHTTIVTFTYLLKNFN